MRHLLDYPEGRAAFALGAVYLLGLWAHGWRRKPNAPIEEEHHHDDTLPRRQWPRGRAFRGLLPLP